MVRSPAAVAALLCLSCARPAQAPAEQAKAPQVVRLWPSKPPGTESWSGPEETADAELPNIGKVYVITNVTVPTLTVFRPEHASGTAMIVVPGGAFRALPWDLDGLETARWLTAHGITALVLKYRVRPPPADGPPDNSFDDFARRTAPARATAVADAEQALRLVRSHSAQFGIDPHKVGMIGFSAGAMATMDAAVAADPSLRPDFAVVLYGALLSDRAPPKNAPPLFIAAAQDDPEAPPMKSVEIMQGWTRAGLPAELHLYEKGGHGFGFRTHHLPVDHWPDALEAWLSARNYVRR